MNYVNLFYILNFVLFLLYYGARLYLDPHMTLETVSLDYIISIALSLLLFLGGYLNAKKGLALKTVFWVFIGNFFLFALSGIFDGFGLSSNILSSTAGNALVLSLAFAVYNLYLSPLQIDLDGSILSFLIPLILSIILPLSGYFLGNYRQEELD